MGLLDQEITEIKSPKKTWALCKYCTMPFLAKKSEFSCQRCLHFVQYELDRKHKLIILFFATTSIVGIIQSYLLIFLIRYIKEASILYFILVLFSTSVGSFAWKLLKKLNI